MKVYVTTGGYDDDHRVEHVFLREEDAAEWCEGRFESDWHEHEVLEAQPAYKPYYCLVWLPHIEDREGDSATLANPFVHDYELVFTADASSEFKLTWQLITQGLDEQRAILRVEGWDKEDVMHAYAEERDRYAASREAGA